MFSVVIPLYNKEHTILNTIKCVLNQTFQNFEVIIVDDGSVDNSVNVINEFTHDSRIKIIRQENQGVSGARNTGVTNAKNKWIAFIDGDDEWFPDYLQKMKEAVDKFPESEMICSAGMGKSSKGEYIPRQIKKYKDQVKVFEFFENPHVFLHIGATVVSKQLFNKVNGFPLGVKRNEDFTFLYSAAFYTKPVYSGYPLSVYVAGVSGQATSNSVYDDDKLLSDIASRYNTVHDHWKKTGAKNKVYPVFLKYELRHFFMVNNINKKTETNRFLLNRLDNSIVSMFSKIEVSLWESEKYATLGVLLTKLTKLKWRMYGYERVN